MFGDKLKALRNELGLKQAEMAHRLHGDTSTYCRWEHKTHPPTHAIERIAKTFEVDAWAWMRGEEEVPEAAPGPKVVHLNTEADKQDQDAQSVGLRLLGRMVDLAEWLMQRSRGGKGG